MSLKHIIKEGGTNQVLAYSRYLGMVKCKVSQFHPIVKQMVAKITGPGMEVYINYHLLVPFNVFLQCFCLHWEMK